MQNRMQVPYNFYELWRLIGKSEETLTARIDIMKYSEEIAEQKENAEHISS